MGSFRNFVRMDPEMFNELEVRLSHRLTKHWGHLAWYRKVLEPGLKLAITPCFLATGNSYKSLMYGFRVAANTISVLVRDVCQAVLDERGDEVIKCTTTPEEWREVAETFSNRWNFHHALSALDGKHVPIKCPKNGGSLYYNYKGFHSIILMALVDGNYKFLWVDVGANGSSSDCQVFNACELKEHIEDGRIRLRGAQSLPGDDKDMPYFITGDDAFPLCIWFMKPYRRRDMSQEQKIFNYRLSRTRRIAENAFGILANRFGCLLKRLHTETQTTELIVMACICLHNIMRMRYLHAQNRPTSSSPTTNYHSSNSIVQTLQNWFIMTVHHHRSQLIHSSSISSCILMF